jgi:hypothetical protein
LEFGKRCHGQSSEVVVMVVMLLLLLMMMMMTMKMTQWGRGRLDTA